MNKLSYMAGVALAAMAISSCDEDTLNIGNSITNQSDQLVMGTSSFAVTTRTVVADSVLALSNKCYLGKVKDPETGTEVTSEFSTQFHVLESMGIVDEQYVGSKDEEGRAVVDSCDLVFFLNSPYKGDSLLAMKMLVREMESPIESGRKFYSNYDQTSLLRNPEDGGISLGHTFTYQNNNDTDSARALSGYSNNIRILFNQPYKAKDGSTYKNYGTYILRQYYDHKDYFSNSYRFIHNVCPGFFFQITDGLGFHSEVSNIGLRLYYDVVRPDTSYRSATVFAGTNEVMRCIKVTNDKAATEKLAQETSHTYLKSPAGLFTAATLPVKEIKQGHENDSLLAANITFQRINNNSSDYRMLGIPQSIMMLPKDSLYSFFEKNKVTDAKMSYITSFSSSNNTYAFSNISNLISRLWQLRLEGLKSDPDWERNHPDWNKVLLVPVSYTSSTSTSTITKIEHDMSLTSTKLVGGEGTPITLNIVYGKFQE